MSSDLEDLGALVADIMSREPESGELWNTLGDLGLATIGIPEEFGGTGEGLAELAAVVEELAAHGMHVPIIEYNTGRWAAGGAAVGEVAVACAEGAAGNIPVAWAKSADQLVLLVSGAERAQLFSLDGRVGDGGDPLNEYVDRVDLRGAAHLELDGPSAEEIRIRLGILRSAALVGATRGAYSLTRKYVREREQFGKSLVKIPAVARALATIRVDVIQAEAALARALEVGTLDAVAIARVVAAQSAGATAHTAHQLHGAMGITQEYPLHQLTRTMWAWRDAETSELDWADHLGAAAFEGGDNLVWTTLTATA